MKIHEYQAKALLQRYGVHVPRGDVVTTASEARAVAERLGTDVVVLKAQIHAGGRGKAGGIRRARSAAEAEQIAGQLLGSRLVTAQTGPEGHLVRRLLVEEGLDIRRELYLAVLLDRNLASPLLMASAAGGMEIEEIARERPEAILREPVPVSLGFQPFQARKLAHRLGLPASLFAPFSTLLAGLYRAFFETDASLVEINPCVLTGDGRLVALDAKMQFDDNGLFRHPEIAALRDPDEEDPLEVEAARYRLNYVHLGGNVGCMVNGAGLAMATMDIIKLAGGEPANFLDVGGGASAEQVRHAFRILLSDPAVRVVFINIFGGILRCDVLASGVVEAARELGVQVPVVVRLEGTNVEQGRAILRSSGLNFIVAETMQDGAAKAVRLASGAA